ncbi:MAG: phosphotransacetylase family protein [Actinomycetia bacterium]|nr:phosphotransacetylase family protein [Actinomycetes bacterium]
MKSLIFLSTEPYSGKTGLALNLAQEFDSRGQKVGFLKPVGNTPDRTDSTVTEKDAVFAKEVLALDDPLDRICPVVLTSRETNDRLRQVEGDGARDRVKEAFKEISEGKDIVVMEGSGHINDGRLYGVSGVDLAQSLNSRAIVVIKLDNPYEIVDDVLVLSDRLGENLGGVIFNWVQKNKMPVIKELIMPFLEKKGIPSFGAIPREESLVAVSVEDLSKALGGRILCAERNKGVMIETFMVGAMGQEQAIRYFRRKARKAVITGGDRSDFQLAALETQTGCLILTGNYPPPSTVLAVAESKGVPVILVDVDTLTAVEKTESMIGQVGIDSADKLSEMRRYMQEYIDIDRLCKVAA